MTSRNRFISRINNQIGLGMDFPSKLQFQDQLINNRGEVVIHETAIACPNCRVGDTEDIYGKLGSCDQCFGGGFIYKKPRQIMGLLTGISTSRSLQDFGFALPGDSVMSISPFLKPGVHDFDKITFTWPLTIEDGEIIERGVWNTRYPTIYAANEDRLGYEAEESILCIDQDGEEYNGGSDFTFDKRKIVWLGKQPEIRKRYTVKYTAFLEWIVFNPEHPRIDSNRDLGSRVLLRRRHVAFLKHDREHQPPALRRAKLNFGDKVSV